MENPEDKQWATKYLLDPLTAPEPSDETGPGTHFSSSLSSKRAPSTSKTPAVANVSDSKSPSVNTYPTPPTSASPTQSDFHRSNPFSSSHRQTAFGDHNQAGPSRSQDEPSKNGKGHRRGSSLNERFAGDMSHRPLDQIRKETKAANRAPHLKKRHMVGADAIDSLDLSMAGTPYHHDGPYDATLLARNTSFQNSPVEAVRYTNREALRATPRENVRDALDKHVPLQGTATIPPGMHGMDGRTMRYEEGADLMREPDAPGGPYKRWDNVKYLPEDYKGKGEPSFTVEKALKEHKHATQRYASGPEGQGNSFEMQTPTNRPAANRQRSASGTHSSLEVPRNTASGSMGSTGVGSSSGNGDVRRSNTTGRRVSEGLKKRFGGLGRHKKTPSEES